MMHKKSGELVVCILAALLMFGLTSGAHAATIRLLKDTFPQGISGYVNHELYWDTNQVVAQAVDEFLFFPEPKLYDPDGEDINAKGQFGSATFTTRCRYNKRGPCVGSAEPSLFIETDFFGNTNLIQLGYSSDLLNVFRLRHAFGVLEWGGNKSLLFGETWHPLYVFNCFADTVSFNGGSPIALFARDPQVSFMYSHRYFDIIAAALSQVDFPSIGPTGGRGVYLRNAVVPNLHLQLKGYIGNHFVGIAGDYKRLVPRLVTNKRYKAYEHINSGIVALYCALNGEKWHVWSQWTLAQNANDVSLLGGFAVHTIDPFTDRRTYANIAVNAWWIDAACKVGDHAEPGIFLGFLHNLGASKPIIKDVVDGKVVEHTVYSFGENIGNLFRISPRLRYFIGNFCAGFEFEYTRAAYGTLDNFAHIVNTTPANNYRALLSLLYIF